ncbi:MAG TPA: hypothetical protein VK622_07630 [Puia sp.]|nr:hypothetical protein [Puia sp.]
MGELAGIYTIRDTLHPYYWDVVYEWEDVLARTLRIPLIPVGKEYDKIYKPLTVRKILNRIGFYQRRDRYFFNPSKYYIAFHIGPPGVYSFHSRRNVIPIIIDFWKSENLKRFESIFSLNECVFITSKEVYNYLVDNKMKIKLGHLALSLPDKMFAQISNTKREFDLIQIGRQNEKATHYVKLLLSEFPQINYLYSERIDGKVQMHSSLNGKLGEFTSRESFLNLLKKTKVSLLSAPGLDDDAERTGGFSPVTPRFLESAACGCHLIGIYPENDDFVYFGINQICVNVDNYESFRRVILSCLRDEKVPDYREFLQNHLTSKRAIELKEKLSFGYAKR